MLLSQVKRFDPNISLFFLLRPHCVNCGYVLPLKCFVWAPYSEITAFCQAHNSDGNYFDCKLLTQGFAEAMFAMMSFLVSY